MGVELRKAGARAFEVTALADHFKAIPAEALVDLIRGVGGEEWQYSFRAAAACRMAIREGDRVDPVTARELCAQALSLPVPRCPHGRPIWHQIAEDTLLKLVDRPTGGSAPAMRPQS
jgi:DNA mismatch repair protein MutL